MSAIKIFNLKDKKQYIHENILATELKDIVNLASDMLGLEIIANNYQLAKDTDGIISSIAIDENYQLIVIEYRYGKFGRLINKGLYYIDYINSHISEFKILINVVKGQEIAKVVNCHPRLLIVSDSASYFDDYAIKKLPYNIEIIRVEKYKNNQVVFEKNFQSKKIDHTYFKYVFKTPEEYNIYNLASEYILSLGDEVIETANDNYLYYRRIKTFAYLYFADGISINYLVSGKYQKKIIKTITDFENIQEDIERAYDEN